MQEAARLARQAVQPRQRDSYRYHTDSFGVLYLTGKPDNYDKIRVNQIGVDDIMGKPIPESKFISKVESLANQYSAGVRMRSGLDEQPSSLDNRPMLENPFGASSSDQAMSPEMIYHGYDNGGASEFGPQNEVPSAGNSQEPGTSWNAQQPGQSQRPGTSWNASRPGLNQQQQGTSWDAPQDQRTNALPILAIL